MDRSPGPDDRRPPEGLRTSATPGFGGLVVGAGPSNTYYALRHGLPVPFASPRQASTTRVRTERVSPDGTRLWATGLTFLQESPVGARLVEHGHR